MEEKKLIKAFEEYTIDKGVAVKLNEDEFIARFAFELPKTKVVFNIIFEDGETDVQIIARNFVNVPKEYAHLGEHYANRLNQEYRWVRFAYNENIGGLFAEHDIDVENNKNVNKILDMVYKMCSIIDIVHAELAKEFMMETEDVARIEGSTLDELLESVKNSAQYA